jgi:hypothetical protein
MNTIEPKLVILRRRQAAKKCRSFIGISYRLKKALSRPTKRTPASMPIMVYFEGLKKSFVNMARL